MTRSLILLSLPLKIFDRFHVLFLAVSSSSTSHNQDLLRNSLPITALALSADGTLVAAGHEDAKVCCPEMALTSAHRCLSALFRFLCLPSLRICVQLSQAPAFPVSVWNNTVGQRRLLYQLYGLQSAATSLKFSRDGKLLVATGAVDSYVVWDLESSDVLLAQKTDRPISTGKLLKHIR